MLNSIFNVFLRQIAKSLFTLLSIVLISKKFGPDGIGMFGLITLLPLLLANFFTFGIQSSYIYYFNTSLISEYILKKCVFNLVVFFTIIGAVLLTVILSYSEYLFPDVSYYNLVIGSFCFPFILLNYLVVGFLQAKKKFSDLNYCQLFQPFMFFTFALLTYINSLHFSILFELYLLSWFLTFIFQMYYIYKYKFIEFGYVDYHNMKIILKYGINSHLSNVVTFLNYKADIYIISLFLSPSAVGVYLISTQISERFWLVSNSISTVLFPTLSHSNKIESRNITKIVFSISLILTSLIVLLSLIPLFYLIPILFGEEFKDSYYLLLFLFPGIISIACSRVISNYIASIGKPELNFYNSLIVLILNIIFNVIFINLFGLVGAALATSLTYMINLILRLITFKRFTGIHFYDLFTSFVNYRSLSLY
jgi:O-antigen/teichoic acid export membrane protein